MSQSKDGLHTAEHLSWKKMQLSRAKLKASSKTSALLAGFAMVALVEMPIDQNGGKHKMPNPLLIAFAVCTTLLVAVHMLALMIATCILPNIEAVCHFNNIGAVHESPHQRLHWYIETAWIFSTVVGLLLFLLEVAILCWIKFHRDGADGAALAVLIILIPVFVVFMVFAAHFYRSILVHKYEITAFDIQKLDFLKNQIESMDVEGRLITDSKTSVLQN